MSQEQDFLIYLLYEGQSEDGRGKGRFYKATKDTKVALAHYKEVKKNPYSVGSVWVLKPNSLNRVFSENMEVKYFGKKVK